MLLCAALLIQVEGLDHETIIPCRRHGDGFLILKDLGYDPKTKYKILQQGFIDTTGRFLDRVEAYKHAIDCGQLSSSIVQSKEHCREVELYSEDLY